MLSPDDRANFLEMGTAFYLTEAAKSVPIRKAFRLFFAESLQDIHAVALLRYKVFAEEISTTTYGQCDDTKTIMDPLDFAPESKTIIAQTPDGTCCGTFRSTNLPFRCYPRYLLGGEQLDLVSSMAGDGSDHTFCSRLAITAPYRKSRLFFDMMKKMIELRFPYSRYALISASPEFERMYKRLGGVIISAGYTNEFGAPRILVRLPLHDATHHENVHSVFRGLIRQLVHQHYASNCSTLPEHVIE